MNAAGARRLQRLLALRQAAKRRATRHLARVAADARTAAEGEAQITRLLKGSTASAGTATAPDLAARATLFALLEPALQQSRARSAAVRGKLADAMTAAAAGRIACEALEARLKAAHRARDAEREEQRLLDTPSAGRRRPFP